jgi:hypothetical protein
LNQMVGKRPEQGEERHPRVLDDEVEQVSVAWPPSKRKVPDPKSMPISMPRRQRGSRRLSAVFRAGKCHRRQWSGRPLRPTGPDTQTHTQVRRGVGELQEKGEIEAHAAQLSATHDAAADLIR